MAPKRKLGNDGPLVSAIGYGAMGLEGYYGGKDNIKNPFLIMRSGFWVQNLIIKTGL